MSKRAIIVVDIQNEYFPGGKLLLQGIEEAAANAAKVIEHARSAKDLVVYFQHESADPEIPFFTPGTPEVAIHSMVAPLEQETVVVKNFPNSFRETGLKELLDQKNIEEVVIIGAMSHMCIDATSRAASDFGYKTTIIHDACATLDLEFDGVTVPASQVHATIMSALAFAYGTVISTEQYVG
ncbi:MAG TPA: cysteine hydrolase [Halomonas sp.]|uniref:cysteine hydrolase family protein n=1 Tax=Halomonadaceae TaxID=28256 RepID=UPI000E7D6F69|nr:MULTISPECIES: cysteine hydrolase family protein [unclassified Halomonas]UTD55174.1 cysteine hydrolase [Halomonas sp. MS1]HBP40666.1 cysteine hydrolase [Halomonas sp.]